MPISRAERRREREPRVAAVFGEAGTKAALDLLELVELAWHDCYGEVGPPEEVVGDILLLSRGDLDGMVRAALLAVVDARDLRLAADDLRKPVQGA